MSTGRRVVVGIGNLDRGDDGVGRLVARALAGTLPGVEVIEHSGEAASLLARIEEAGVTCFVDACVSGAAVGTVQRIDVHDQSMPDIQFGLSTHSFGLGSAIALGRSLGILPARCLIYAIEAGTFEAGAPLSPAVSTAIPAVAAAVRDEVIEDA